MRLYQNEVRYVTVVGGCVAQFEFTRICSGSVRKKCSQDLFVDVVFPSNSLGLAPASIFPKKRLLVLNSVFLAPIVVGQGAFVEVLLWHEDFSFAQVEPAFTLVASYTSSVARRFVTFLIG